MPGRVLPGRDLAKRAAGRLPPLGRPFGIAAIYLKESSELKQARWRTDVCRKPTVGFGHGTAAWRWGCTSNDGRC